MYQIKVAKEICEKCISDHSVKPNLTIEEQAMLFPTFFLAYKEKIITKFIENKLLYSINSDCLYHI